MGSKFFTALICTHSQYVCILLSENDFKKHRLVCMTLYEHAAPALFYFVENIIPFFVHKNYLMIKWGEQKTRTHTRTSPTTATATATTATNQQRYEHRRKEWKTEAKVPNENPITPAVEFRLFNKMISAFHGTRTTVIVSDILTSLTSHFSRNSIKICYQSRIFASM